MSGISFYPLLLHDRIYLPPPSIINIYLIFVSATTFVFILFILVLRIMSFLSIWFIFEIVIHTMFIEVVNLVNFSLVTSSSNRKVTKPLFWLFLYILEYHWLISEGRNNIWLVFVSPCSLLFYSLQLAVLVEIEDHSPVITFYSSQSSFHSERLLQSVNSYVNSCKLVLLSGKITRIYFIPMYIVVKSPIELKLLSGFL